VQMARIGAFRYKSNPQALKRSLFSELCGTPEVVPFPGEGIRSESCIRGSKADSSCLATLARRNDKQVGIGRNRAPPRVFEVQKKLVTAKVAKESRKGG
jgi:hypothetical protein